MSVVVPVPQDRPPERQRTPVSVRRLARFLVAILVLCGVAAFPASAFFDLHTVTVVGNAAVGADEVLHRAGVGPGLSAFRVNAWEIRARLLKDPRIEDAAVAVVLPSRLQVLIRERTPVAAIAAGDGYVLLSSEGVALAVREDPDSLPMLVVDRFDPAEAAVGTALASAGARLGARIAGTLPESMKDRVVAVRVDASGEAVLTLRDGISVRLGGPGGIADRLEMLPEALDAIAERGLRVESLDLRVPGNIVVQQAGSPASPALPGDREENPPARGIHPVMHRPSAP